VGEGMIWLLLVVHLNLLTTPIQINHAMIVETFSSQQKCSERHSAFFDGAAQENIQIPDDFNLGCVPFKIQMV
jgi:hypothetical protein